MGQPKALRIVDKRMERVKRHRVHTSETKAALLVQRCFRGHCVRREVGFIMDVVRKIQAHFRGSRVRREVAEAVAAAEAVQRVLRGHQSRRLAAALRAERERRRADERQRAQRDTERTRQLPTPPESDDEDDAEEAGLSRSERSRRGAARSMLFQMAQEGSTERDIENIAARAEPADRDRSESHTRRTRLRHSRVAAFCCRGDARALAAENSTPWSWTTLGS